MTVHQDPHNPFGKPPDTSEYVRIKTFLYNNEEGTVCGKDAKNWGKKVLLISMYRYHQVCIEI